MRSSSIFISAIFLFFLFAGNASAVRIKDIASIKGIRNNQIVGYGLVVGLNGTGDKGGSGFTMQSLANMMDKMGIRVDKAQLKVKNVASVMVTSEMPPFARVGGRIDISVSSVGDAKSLAGGTLLMTPLKGADDNIYAIAQGPLAIGGVGAEGGGGGAVKNHLLVGRIAGGATVEKEVPFDLDGKKELTMFLSNPDFTTAQRVAEKINGSMGPGTAKAVDSGTVMLEIPPKLKGNVASFISLIETLDVKPDSDAKIIVNEKTGTVVIGENVKISKVAISHGNLSITVQNSQQVSQPAPLSGGQTVTAPATSLNIKEEKQKLVVLPESATIGDLVKALNALGVTPRDMISIFQSIKAAGALQADLEII